MLHRKDAKENGEEWKPPSYIPRPVPGRIGTKGQATCRGQTASGHPRAPQRAPVPIPVSLRGSLGANAGVPQLNPAPGRERVRCRNRRCLIAPCKDPQGHGRWGDACLAGTPSAGHRRVENRGDAEKGFGLPGAAVQAPPGHFPPIAER